MSISTMTRDNLWEVTSRTIVYAAIGAALYAVLVQFSFLLPGTANVSLRPGFAIVTFFGVAFGPIVGLFTGLVGNAIGDQISGWGLLTSWNWSVANGLVGLLAGLLPVYLLSGISNKIVMAGAAAAIAVIVGFLFVFTDLIIGTADTFDTALSANYLPVVISNLISAVILTPILVLVWEPIKEQLGR